MSTDFLSGPLAQAFGLTLLHTLWQGAMVAAIAAAALALLRNGSSAARYAIACGGLAIVVVMAVGTAYELYQPHSAAPLQPAPHAIAPAAAPADTVVISLVSPAPTLRDRAMQLFEATRAHVPQIIMLWLAGVLFLSIRLGVAWWRVQAMTRRNAIDADEVWQRTAMRLARALHLERPVRIVVSAAVEVPSVIGWMKPVVLIAASSVSGLTAEQLEMVLAHELAHIRRHDFLVNAIQSVVETLLFYNPAVWYLSRRIRIERENCCDDLAVAVSGDRVGYARALAQLESMRAVPTPAAAANGGSLVDRVRRLVGSESERSLFSSGWTAAAAVTSFVLLLGLATAPLFAERPAGAAPQTAGTQVEVTAQKNAQPAAARKPKPANDDDADSIDVPEPPTIEPAEPPLPAIEAIAAVRAARAMRVVAPRIAARVAAGIPAGIAVAVSVDDEESPAPPGKLSVNDLIALKIQNVTPEYVEEMRGSGIGDVSIRDVIAMKIHGVTPDYVKQMRASLGTLTTHDVVALKVQSVTPEYVAALRSAGAPIKNAHDVISMKVQGVTPDFVRQLAAAGYDHLTVHDIVRLAMFGVNSDFIREMSKYKSNK